MLQFTIKVTIISVSIKRRRGHKRAMIAIARMLLTVIYNIILKSVAFDVVLCERNSTKHLVNSAQSISIDQAMKVLVDSGFTVSPGVAA